MTKTRDSASPIDATNKELIDTLIAISIIAKRLVAKQRQSNERRICHNIVTLTFQIMGIMIKTVCFIVGFDNSSKSVNSHIHKAELSIVFYLLLTIKIILLLT